MKVVPVVLMSCFVALSACSSQPTRLIIAAGTTLVDSGLIEALAAEYETDHPDVDLSVVAEPTALALELGRQGAADLLLVHAPDLERDFVEAGFSLLSHPVVNSRFVLVGPPELAGRFDGYGAVQAFDVIADEGLAFVSRADGSGTHETELGVWEEAGVDPSGAEWYIETGQGMGPTIQVADQRGASTLSEYGAFIAAVDSVGLVDLRIDPAGLDNPYTGHVVADGNAVDEATMFLEWLTSSEGSDAIIEANQALFGEIVYEPPSH
jgi:tungstate transport system substrate-binding protein